ncbi:hypothetical protein CLAIMM_05773 isoform 2 [Cladophialophora immunda]|nr:hypothetical protein CLAIMM_05773 isoform 2 [Cladophialophora immunda]
MAPRQSAIVTGGSSGIGKATAHKLASRGINVLVADINVADGEKVSTDLKAKYGVDSAFVKLDTALEADVVNMVDTAVKLWGRIDWACNCAGKAEILTEGEEGVTEKVFDEMYQINQRGTWFCQRHEAVQMRKQEPRTVTLTPSERTVETRGSIVNISSVNGIVGLGQPGYSSAKAGIIAFTRTGAQFYGKDKIRVNAVLPGSIRTDAMGVWLEQLSEDKRKFVVEGLVNSTPLARQGAPEELANAVSYFLSDESTYVNGTTLVVDDSTSYNNNMAGWVLSEVSSSRILGGIIQYRDSLPLVFLVALIGYVVVKSIYRVYFHPLAKYPGPFWAKVTSLYDFYQALSERRAHNFLALHKKYGPIVRYAPNKLVFNEPQAWQDIYAYKANVRKSDLFAASQSNPESTDTFSELYKEPALKKRKVLSYGFSESSLRSFEGEKNDHQINIFCRQLVSPETERIKDMSLWFNYLSYDIMGELVFGRGFGMLTDPSLRYILDLIDSTVFSYLLGGIIPWLHKSGLITLLMPRIFFMRKKFVAESNKRIVERIKLGPDAVGVNGRRDFFHYLLNGKDENGNPLSHARLGAEGVLLILAGSDTSSACKSSGLRN